MVVITLQREKCIGCNYCVEAARAQWRMSKKDGKTNLLNSVEKKGFHTTKVDDVFYEDNVVAAEVCPVNIISVKQL